VGNREYVSYSFYIVTSANVIICVVEQVKWFLDRALRDRAVEEVEMLEAEFRRAIK
jgi:hypothetical protein